MKKNLILALSLVAALSVVGCGEEEVATAPVVEQSTIQVVTETPAVTTETETEEEESREGMYRSELTNEWIDEELKNQRPIACMVDNEKTALPHYGLTKSDVVYEITNSLENDGVTRLMVLFKDYNSVDQIGSIRSTRPTNCQLVPEWNAILCHDGGPFYIDDYIANPYVDHISGEFARIDNGKSREFTEYVTTSPESKSIVSLCNNHKIDLEYNDYYKGPHYNFTSEAKVNDLSQYSSVTDATHIQMPYKHNKPYLDYDEASHTYLYSEYGQAHKDPGNNNEQLSFKNLLIQNCRYVKFDSNGYMMFHSIDYGREGYYITEGKAIKVTWSKGTEGGSTSENEMTPTKYYDEDGNEIVLNTGRTYVALVPDDIWSGLEIK